MALKKVRCLCLSVVLILIGATYAFCLDVPRLIGRVNDYANILSFSTEQQLDAVLAELEGTDSTQIVVLTIPSLEGDSLEDFSIRVAEKWKTGQANKDNGAILLISKNDRKIRIEVGYGLEGSLTDLTSGRIIRDIIAPHFKMGNFDAGVSDGVQAMIQAVRGEFKADAPIRSPHQHSPGLDLFAILAVIILINMMGRIKRSLGAISGGILFPILGAELFNLGLLIVLVLIPIGILAGLFLSLFGGPLSFSSSNGSRRGDGGYWTSRGGYGGGFGGGWGGYGGGGGGSGGFSGGGGGFGGGGASGGW